MFFPIWWIKMKLISNLYEYQKEAVEKLCHVKVGALYMEMGTGKTRTALELIHRRLVSEKVRQVLWLCPFSISRDLSELIGEHAEDFENVIRIAGIESLSASIKLYYDLIQYVQYAPTYLIVDESLLVKNPFAYRTIRIYEISKKCPYKLILNGTPVSKNEADLFSQWYILDWRILGYQSYYSFSANHLEMDPERPGHVVRVLNKDYLARKISPYTYQCRKEDVLNLPPKWYFSRCFSLLPEQEQLYNEASQILLEQVDELKPETIYRLFSCLQAITSGLCIEFSKNHMFSKAVPFLNAKENPRIKILLKTLDEFSKEQAVIYCKYTQEILDIVSVLGEKAVPFYGNISVSERQKNKTDFKNGKAQYMVANKSCAKFGLNLQFSCREIFYNNDWDWGTRAQAEDRVHRAGQTKDVYIYDIFAANTIDESILSCLSRKENLSEIFKKSMAIHNRETLKQKIYAAIAGHLEKERHNE